MRTNREVADLLGHMTQDERALVEMFIERLTAGRFVYGPWDEPTDQRDFRKEALEEGIDLAVYQLMNLRRQVNAGLEGRLEAVARAQARYETEGLVAEPSIEKLGSDEPVESEARVPFDTLLVDEFQPALANGTGVTEKPEKTWADLVERCKAGRL